MPTWSKNVLKRINLNSARENIELRATNNKALIMPFESFNASKRPLLLIHGVGTPMLTKDLATRFDEAGLQVLVVFYDDLGVAPHLNGRQIASKLNAIREEFYSKDSELDIVAHSMGGIVARCCLNELQDPKWRDPGNTSVGSPRAGFKHVRIRTIDTPWSGFGPDDATEYDPDDEDNKKILRIMKLLGVEGAWDLAAGGETMNKLYDVELQGVDLQNLVAYRPGKKDWVPSLPECEPKEARLVGLCLAYGNKMPELRVKLRNLYFGLRQDSRFPALRQALHRALVDKSLDLKSEANAQLVKELTRIHDAVMPRFVGRHITIVIDKENDAEDLVDYLVSELSN
jgi:pimeloyl-ACP methyl ester carboxylesterase